MERKTEYSEAEKLDSAAKRKKDKSKNKRRFSDEQISLLESIFEADSKLEPRRKVQLARELGLQPRQVAIWFQNKRARWKSKQIEQDFRTLKADYDRLASRFESLNEEKQSLLMQLQKLNDLVGKPQPQDGNLDSQGLDTNCETDQVRPSNLQGESEQRGVMESKKNNTGNDAGDCGDVEVEGHELLTMGHVNASVPDISPQDWTRFDSGVLFDPSRITSQWLNFWT